MRTALCIAVALCTGCGALPMTEAAVTDMLNERLVSFDARLTAGASWDGAYGAEVEQLKTDMVDLKATAVEEAVARVTAALPEAAGDGVTKKEGLIGIGLTLLSLIFRHRIGGFMGKLGTLVPDNREE